MPGLFTEEDRQTAIERLARYAGRPRFRDARTWAITLLTGGLLDDLPVVERFEVLSNPNFDLNLDGLLLFDLEEDAGRTIVDQYLDQRGHDLSIGERAYLEAVRRTCVRLYQVEEVVRDEGLRLRDLWDQEVVWVSERSATHELVRWDLLAARVMPRPDDTLVLEGDLYLLPRRTLDRVRASLDQTYRAWAGRHPAADSFSFFKRCAALVFGPIWIEEVLAPARPMPVTPEGDEVEFGEAIYATSDPDRLARTLDANPFLERNDDGGWVWLEKDGEDRSVRAEYHVEGPWLRIETISRARMRRARDLIKLTARHLLRHHSTRYQGLDTLSSPVEHAPGGGPDDEKERSPEIEIIERDMLDKHYRRWLDEPVPALDGRTPRAAATTASGRARVVELLRDFECSEARCELRTGHRPYDFTWLWRALGLDPEDSPAPAVRAPT